MQIIADYEQSALNAPQSFRDGIQAAINILDSIFSTPITVKVQVGYGDLNGTTLQSQNGGVSAFGGPALNYTTLRADLIANSDIDGNSASLPNTASVNGESFFIIAPAQERIFGLLPAVNNTATDDGSIGMGTNITGNGIISTALHEITHVLGRAITAPFPSSLELFRFTSVGNRLFASGSTAVPAYYSMDNGATDIADFGQTSDPGDFLNDFRTPSDPFNEFGGLPNLTTTDIEIMEALGFRAGVAPVAFVPNDFDGDGNADVLWRSGAGVAIWQMNGTAVSGAYVTSGGAMVNPDASWNVVGISDFNNDHNADVMWRNNSGLVVEWLMNGTQITTSTSLANPDASWTVQNKPADFA